MSICVVVDSLGNLVSSNAIPCDGVLLIAETDMTNQITPELVGLIFAACASVYGIVFVIKLTLQQLGFRH